MDLSPVKIEAGFYPFCMQKGKPEDLPLDE